MDSFLLPSCHAPGPGSFPKWKLTLSLLSNSALCVAWSMIQNQDYASMIIIHHAAASHPSHLGLTLLSSLDELKVWKKNSKRPFGGVFPNTTAIPGLCEVHLLLLLVFWFAIWLKQTPVSTSGDPVTPFCASTSGVTMCVTLTPSHCAI